MEERIKELEKKVELLQMTIEKLVEFDDMLLTYVDKQIQINYYLVNK